MMKNVSGICAAWVLLATCSGTASADPFAYVPARDSDIVYVIDLATNTVVDEIPVGLAPRGVAILPDGSKVYIGNRDGGSVSVIDTATATVVDEIVVGSEQSGPRAVVATLDGTSVYVAVRSAGEVVEIDTATDTIVDVIDAGPKPIGLAVHPGGDVT